MAERPVLKRVWDCDRITAVDGAEVQELLHPDRDGVDLPYSLAIARVEVGDHTAPHRLDHAEVYHVLDGRGLAHVDDASFEITVGDALLIPAGARQWIENIGAEPLRFAAIVSPPWRAEIDRRV
ncbi:MAG: cupin domain-containing protein [Chromatiales bacterium]|nr:cupin domain-containing protein [Chromatiales bacterium]